MTPKTPEYAPPAPSVRYRKPVRSSVVWWLRCLGIAAFFLVLLQLPKSEHLQLSHIDLRWLGLAMLLTILQLLLEALAWQWLLWRQGIQHPYPKTIIAYLASQYLGLVTPGHVGEFLAAGYISMETGITFGYALSSVVMKKILTWSTIVGFGIWSLPLLTDIPMFQGVKRIAVTGAIVLVTLSLGIGVWVFSLRRLAKKWQKLSPWQIDLTEFSSGMRHLVSVQLVVVVAVMVLAFSLLFAQFDAVLRALGIVLPIGQIGRIVSLSRIIARIVPVSFVGFGSKDAAVIWTLAHQGIDPSIGLTTTLLLLICSYLVTLLLSGLCWWMKPLVIRRVTPSASQIS